MSKPSKTVSRQVKFSDDMWAELDVQAAVERKAGRGDIVRKACKRYLEETREARLASLTAEVD